MNSQHVRGERYLWQLPIADARQIADLAAAYNLSFPIVQTLLSRGFSTKEQINGFLFGSHADVAHPSLMKDAEKAVDRLLRAINSKEPILIFGDYDVDGITSSALMMICLLPLGAKVNFFLPHRTRDGYGISSRIVDRAARNGYKVIVTVDNGIAAFEPALKAKECGIDLIITDHHRPHVHLPEAFAIVNPNQVECGYPFKVLAGVGVGFKLLCLLYERLNLPLPAKAYELLLLGTVADVVPLLGENRFWVRHGLNYINKVESISFHLLKQNGKVTKPRISATDIGFSITPQINALGRLEDPRQGVKFLIGSDVQEVEEVGRVLLSLNEARKEIERAIFEQVAHAIETKKINLDEEQIIIAAHTDWPPGVIGLVASRLVGTYGKPAILFHLTSNGMAKGSCRSIPEFNIFDALQAAGDLVVQFGGHSAAAGLAIKAENLPHLKQLLEKRIKEQLTPYDLQRKIVVDAQIKLDDLTTKFMSDKEHLEPFGYHNSDPIFYVKDLLLVQKPQLLKNAHVKCSVFADGVIKPLIFFNRPELYERLVQLDQNFFSVAACVNENHWNGRVNIELTGLDLAQQAEGAP